MNWIELHTDAQLDHIRQSSEIAVLFKHSTRCPVSSMAKRSLEFDSGLVPDGTPFYYLDLIRYRDLSDRIAKEWNVVHESPQVLVVQGDRCIYDASHADIQMGTILTFVRG